MRNIWLIFFIVGAMMVVGRLVTGMLYRSGIETTTLFFALQTPAYIMLAVGVLGLQIDKLMKEREKK